MIKYTLLVPRGSINRWKRHRRGTSIRLIMTGLNNGSPLHRHSFYPDQFGTDLSNSLRSHLRVKMKLRLIWNYRVARWRIDIRLIFCWRIFSIFYSIDVYFEIIIIIIFFFYYYFTLRCSFNFYCHSTERCRRMIRRFLRLKYSAIKEVCARTGLLELFHLATPLYSSKYFHDPGYIEVHKLGVYQ